MTAYMDIGDLQDSYVLCRTLGHAWDDNPGATVDSDLFAVATGVLALRCTRCSTERFDYLGKGMGLYARYYRYPDKYRGVPGEQRGRPQMRAELVRRSLLVRRYQAKKR